MRILALVTARGGSKRLPGKNLRPLGGRPLIVWSIEVAKGIAEICDIVVSTDDSAIAAVARGSGAVVPWLRPASLATDSASSVDVCLHALDWYEGENGKVDGLLLLQPTSPFRKRSTVERGIRLFSAYPHRSVLGISPARSHPASCFKIEGAIMRPFLDDADPHLPSQDLRAAYVVNGALYLIAPDQLRTQRSFYSNEVMPLVIDAPDESIDIDTQWDWMMAETIVLQRARTA